MPATYQYLRHRSFLHEADAISKMLWLLLLSIVAFLLGSPVFLFGQIALLVFCGLVLGRIPLGHFVRGTAVLSVLMPNASNGNMYRRQASIRPLAWATPRTLWASRITPACASSSGTNWKATRIA